MWTPLYDNLRACAPVVLLGYESSLTGGLSGVSSTEDAVTNSQSEFQDVYVKSEEDSVLPASACQIL